MYNHLTKENRFEIAVLLKSGHSLRFCANKLGFDHSAIIREVNENKDSDGVYRPASAHKRAILRRKSSKSSSKKIVNNLELEEYIVKCIVQKHWSPEQIAGRLKRVSEATVSHETIYQWIYDDKPYLKQYLRCKKGKYRRKRGTKAREKKRELAKIRRIDERPEIVDERVRIGDWEGDTIVGKERKQRILTHNERVSGYLIASKLDRVRAEIVQRKIIKIFKMIPKSKKHTLTYDNGSEMGKDDLFMEKKTRITIYRANPYHSWERGSNENINGLLREFFPKGSYFAKITQKDINKVVRLINHRPRKRLNYLTPHELFIKGWCSSN